MFLTTICFRNYARIIRSLPKFCVILKGVVVLGVVSLGVEDGCVVVVVEVVGCVVVVVVVVGW